MTLETIHALRCGFAIIIAILAMAVFFILVKDDLRPKQQ